MQRHSHRAVDRGEREQCPAPAAMGDQQAGQRHEDGAGEAGDDGDCEQRGAPPRGVNQVTMTANAGS
ncbi:hypothetical protein ACL02O_06740 [Micromonospora sp. MS34]|uniref:hypothetical protein n=1 Tax=Micromonospora sp. MS34 TaxID=3385971 RepID=UPI00399F436C